jgi:hypothetical protein
MREKLEHVIRAAWRVLGVGGIIFSIICTFLGVAPLKAVSFVLGPHLVAQLQYFRNVVLGMTAEQARWMLIVCGDLSFAIGLWYLFLVHFANRQDKLYVRREVAQKDYKDIYDRLDETERQASDTLDRAKQALAKALQKDRTARRIHDKTYLLLKKIRETKTEG